MRNILTFTTKYAKTNMQFIQHDGGSLMSITKSYNKQTGIYYAYETTYEWSDEKKKKVQHKKELKHSN